MGAFDNLDWSLVQSFLAVAETGSHSAAAKQLGLTQPTVGRQIRSLEQSLGVTMFQRQARGMSLTPQGEAMLPHAKAMYEAASVLRLHAAGKANDLSGTVRITASVFSSQFFLPPILTELREALPEIQIELAPNDKTDNLLFGEADIAVRMYRPTQLDMVTRHLGDVQLGMFAAQSYIQKHGRPLTVEDVMTHDIVGYDRNDMMIREFAKLDIKVDPSFFPVRCDNQIVIWELVRSGAGIGFGPISVGKADPLVEHLPIDIPLPRLEVWLTAHETVRKAPRVDAVWRLLSERLAEACDPPA